MFVRIFRAGFHASVQDLGRIGFRDAGVSLSGALDTHALRVANVLVGNDQRAAGIEFTSGKMRLEFADARTIAWCGGDYDVTIGSLALPAGRATAVGENSTALISGPRSGARGWLGISGGIDVPLVLRSRSTDLRAEFGGWQGRTLRDGDVLALAPEEHRAAARGGALSSWGAPHDWAQAALAKPVLRFIQGSDWQSFTEDAHERFAHREFVVSAESDRMGVRFTGCELAVRERRDLLSEAVAPGTIQVPPAGGPLLLLNDCQTIGGYLKIAHVISVDLSIASQLRAGDKVRFREVSLKRAQALAAVRARDFNLFRAGVGMHYR